jgi:hypothetical protein
VVVCVGTDEADMDEFVRGNAGISAHFQRNVTSALSAGDVQAVEGVTRNYDFYHHELVHASQSELLPTDFLRRFCVLGTPDECISRLSDLLEIGLSHLVLVGGSRDIDEKSGSVLTICSPRRYYQPYGRTPRLTQRWPRPRSRQNVCRHASGIGRRVGVGGPDPRRQHPRLGVAATSQPAATLVAPEADDEWDRLVVNNIRCDLRLSMGVGCFE